MKTENNSVKNVLLLLLKDFSVLHTVTSLAKELHLSRVGTWKILKRLESTNFVEMKPTGSGKTNTILIQIKWKNILLGKSLSLYLTEEALNQKRWRSNFTELEKVVDFLLLYGSILYSQKEANDIDLMGVVSKKNKFIKIQQIIDKIQKTQNKKIHLINFTTTEFKQELLKPNIVFIDAIKKGVILFGQDNFIKFIEKVHKK